MSSHLDALITDCKHDHDNGGCPSDQAPPLSGGVEAFMHLIEAGWDVEATRAISRRLCRTLEHRDRACVVADCGATRGLHAHDIRHWEDGRQTEPAKVT